MPIAFLRSAAAAAVIICGASGGARAAPEAPLTGLPFFVDSAGKLIGPYLPNNAGVNAVLLQISGRIVAAPANNLGFFERTFTLFYKNRTCAEPAFMSANTLPTAGNFRGTLFYPSDAREVLTLRSRAEFVQGGPTPECVEADTTGTFAKAKSVKVDSLGFTPPFELRAKAPN